MGPVHEFELRELLEKGSLSTETLVWHVDMPDWTPWSTLFPPPPTQNMVLEAVTAPKTRPAGFWIRGVALLVDGVFLQMAGLGLRVLLGNWVDFGSDKDPSLNWFILNLILLISYNTYFVGRYAGTPGKILLRLRIVRQGDLPMDYHLALMRYLYSFFSGITLGFGYFMAIRDPQKRTLHDRMAGTTVQMEN